MDDQQSDTQHSTLYYFLFLVFLHTHKR